MKITYDKQADALLLRFKEGRVSSDKKLDENVFAGYSREGELLEIQVLEVKAIEPSWISLEATAKLVGVSTRTVMRWIETGKVNPPKVGRDYRFTAEMVQALAGEALGAAADQGRRLIAVAKRRNKGSKAKKRA